jgi:hypothetical protein
MAPCGLPPWRRKYPFKRENKQCVRYLFIYTYIFLSILLQALQRVYMTDNNLTKSIASKIYSTHDQK